MFLRDETYTNDYGIEMKKEYYGYYDENGNEVVTATVDELRFIEPVELEPTQLDRIEEALNRSQQEMIDREIDKYTLDLINNGLL